MKSFRNKTLFEEQNTLFSIKYQDGHYIVYQSGEMPYWMTDVEIIEEFEVELRRFVRSRQKFYVVIDDLKINDMIRDRYYRKVSEVKWLGDLPGYLIDYWHKFYHPEQT